MLVLVVKEYKGRRPSDPDKKAGKRATTKEKAFLVISPRVYNKG
jgi:hypothetical protein